MKKQQHGNEKNVSPSMSCSAFHRKLFFNYNAQDGEFDWTKALPPLQEFTDKRSRTGGWTCWRLKAAIRDQEGQLRAAITAAVTKISLGFSRARDTTNVVSTGFGIAIDLPLFDRNQGGIALKAQRGPSCSTNMLPACSKRAARWRTFSPTSSR